MNLAFTFSPLVPWPLIFIPLGLGLLLVAAALFRRAGRGMALRVAALLVLALALANPLAVREERELQPDVAVIVVDRSPSQEVGDRKRLTETALQSVQAALARYTDLEVRTVTVDAASEGADEGTHLFQALSRALAEIPRQRFAGAVLITDGQVHDVPAVPAKTTSAGARTTAEGAAESAKAPPLFGGPVHALLTGRRGEIDRRIVVEKAPSYGIVGRNVTVAYRIEDRAPQSETRRSMPVRVTLRRIDGTESTAVVPVGRSGRFEFQLDHAGPNVLELEVEPAQGELSTTNNRALVSINGVRDRLRVLLVSGQPHAGERTWRNLLKSDPSVDLVHFTILRPPEKDDFTPLRELALIAFPVQELFEAKLKEFDLIVFDRYVVRDVLPNAYLRNIGNYVREGGALLFAVGPEFAGVRSLYQTPLGEVMPGTPTGKVMEQGFHPMSTELGRRHPVTAALPGDIILEKGQTAATSAIKPAWGRWFRQVEANPRAGVVVMEGAGDRPLLLLDRVGKGRVAQVMSDHIWLWARGFEGGGPQAELLRRLAHWLMKEPDLEEEKLSARAAAGKLTVERRSLSDLPAQVTVTAPSGATQTVEVQADASGIGRATIPVPEMGLYKLSDGKNTALAPVGSLNALEMADLRTTADALAPVAEATGGGIQWLVDGVPDVRRVRPERTAAGRGWLGLRQNESFAVTGVTQISLLPGLLVLTLVLGGLMGAWWREGR